MEKPTRGTTIICCCTTILLLGLIGVSTSIAAEFKRTKARDLKLDGNLCSLPGSPAFGLGITALICLLAAQILGTCVGGSSFCCSLLHKKKKLHNDITAKIGTFATILLVLSWITFGLAILLLGVATSMNKRQPYGEGWLKGDCYVVKGGVYIGAAMLGLVAVVFLLSFLSTMADQGLVQSEPGQVYTQTQSGKTQTP
ncbi:hypothetical protein AAC387_Pa06g0234 [Persea americana]